MTRTLARNGLLRAFTDYPVEGATGVVEVELLAYDRDKYVTVQHAGMTEDVKAGYLFQDTLLTKHLSDRSLYALPTVPGGSVPTKRQVHAERMARRRQHSTSYTLWVGETRHDYRNLHDALRHFSREYRTHDCVLRRTKKTKGSSVSSALADSTNGAMTVYILRSRNRTVLHKHHFRIGGL